MSTIELDPMDRPVRGARAIGKCIGESESRTKYMLRTGQIDADKKGKIWTSTGRRLVNTFAGRATQQGAAA